MARHDPSRTATGKPADGRPGNWLAAGSVALAAFFCAFVLPFLLPSTRQVYSAAYAAGSSNKLAEASLALLALAVMAGTAWLTRRTASSPMASSLAESSPAAGDPKLSRGLVITGTLLVALWTVALAIAIARSGQRYGESAYFLERIRDVLQFHARIYRDLEFPYGPLLLLPPVWLVRALHVSVQAGYFTWLSIVNVLGVLLAAYCLNRLAIGRLLRATLFGLCCLEQMNPLMGLNYSLGKFVLPFAVLFWASRLNSHAQTNSAQSSDPQPHSSLPTAPRAALRQALAYTAGHLLTIMVSPELGVGLAGAIVACSGLAAYRRRSFWPLLSWLAPVLAYSTFVGIFGREFLDRLGNASAGALNLVIEPLPFLYIFLAALVWFSPRAVGLRLQSVQAPMLLGAFVLSLGLLPGALGRADPLHVYFNGWGVLALSAVGITGRRQTLLWAAMLLALGVEVQATNFKIYSGAMRGLATQSPLAPEFGGEALRNQTGGAGIALPALFQVPLADELELRRAGLNLLDYRAGLGDLWDRDAEQAKVAHLRQSDWALLPLAGFEQEEDPPNQSSIKLWLRLGYRYPLRHQPYRVGVLLERELADHWIVVERFQQTQLLHRIR